MCENCGCSGDKQEDKADDQAPEAQSDDESCQETQKID